MKPLARRGVVLLLLLTGCSTQPFAAHPALKSRGAEEIRPLVVQTQRHGDWTTAGTGSICPDICSAVVSGPNATVWALDTKANSAYRATMSGQTTAFPMPPGFHPSHLAAGADKNIYISGYSATYLVRMTNFGTIHEIPIPDKDETYSDGILATATAVWFLEGGHVGELSPNGTIKQFTLPSGSTSNFNAGITIGPNGDVWFVDTQAQTLGYVDPTSGAISEFGSGSFSQCAPYDIAFDAYYLWVGCGSALPELAKVSANGKATYLSLVDRVGQNPGSMAVGPDGGLWMVDTYDESISDLDPATNTLTTYIAPSLRRRYLEPSFAIAVGPDGNLWTGDYTQLDVFILKPLSVKPASVVLGSVGATQDLSVVEKGERSWTSASSDPAIASVAQGRHANEFIVTAVATGSCDVTISDGIGNSFTVKVEVQ